MSAINKAIEKYEQMILDAERYVLRAENMDW